MYGGVVEGPSTHLLYLIIIVTHYQTVGWGCGAPTFGLLTRLPHLTIELVESIELLMYYMVEY